MPNTNPTSTAQAAAVVAAANAAPVALAPTATDANAAMLADLAALAPAEPATPAMRAAAARGASRAGVGAGKATPSGHLAPASLQGKPWGYTTSGVYNGRGYKGNPGGLLAVARVLVAASLQAPGLALRQPYKGMAPDGADHWYGWARQNGHATGINADRVYCGLADLADLAGAFVPSTPDMADTWGPTMPSTDPMAALVVWSAGGHRGALLCKAGPGLQAHMAACLAASKAYGRPVWVCPADNVALAAHGADVGAVLGPWPQAGMVLAPVAADRHAARQVAAPAPVAPPAEPQAADPAKPAPQAKQAPKPGKAK